MAESFIFNIAERIVEKVAQLVVEEVSLAFNVQSDLRKLEETMSSIKAVLLDAKRQQQHNERLSRCIWKLRDIFYDAEDVLDEFEREALQKEVANHPSSSTKVRCSVLFSCPLKFSTKMDRRIKKINESFNEIADEWKSFNLGVGGESRRVIHRETHSFVNSSDVIGRDEDKEKIISQLMKPNDGGNIGVIPVVAIGGMGKTTLAQFVYNDKKVIEHFTKRMWVCVSEEFDLTRLLREIIHSTKREKVDDSFSLDTLQTQLRDRLSNERFLLVLDDVWNEDRAKWMELRNLLLSLSRLPGSKIIVTTRSLKVASIMGSADPYDLKGLPHDDCLTVFRKWAFKDGDERPHPNLMRIGEEIVKKCKGVPLAVRTLGGLLYGKFDEHEWISIRDSELCRVEQSENDILPVLKLSYIHLPSHLQRCLTYLSLYKKDHTYFSDDAIQFWLANGLLECPKQNEEWEDVGSRYLKDLWSRCFIQDLEYKGFFLSFKLHDLIHDLAVDLTQKECKTVSSQSESIHENIRHLSFWDERQLKVSQNLKKLKRVRTVVAQLEMVDKCFINFCASNFKYLRTLDLRYSSIEALPSSIGTLMHLRYLDSNACHKLRKLPSSFYELQSLLTLKMEGVPLMRLPDRMQSLIRLRCLELTVYAMHLTKIRPGCWSSLQYLGLFGCANSQCLFEGMQYLTSLRILYLDGCRDIVSLPRSLKFLTKLEYLQLYHCSAINLHMEPEEEEDQHLQLSLKSFSIELLVELKDLPRLLLEGSSSTLQYIKIAGCPKLKVLPQWLQNLTSLQKLELSRYETLSERCQRDGGADWPKIAHVPDVTLI